MLDFTSVTVPVSELLDGSGSTLNVAADAVFGYESRRGARGLAEEHIDRDRLDVAGCDITQMQVNWLTPPGEHVPAPGLTTYVKGAASSMFAGIESGQYRSRRHCRDRHCRL